MQDPSPWPMLWQRLNSEFQIQINTNTSPQGPQRPQLSRLRRNRSSIIDHPSPEPIITSYYRVLPQSRAGLFYPLLLVPRVSSPISPHAKVNSTFSWGLPIVTLFPRGFNCPTRTRSWTLSLRILLFSSCSHLALYFCSLRWWVY